MQIKFLSILLHNFDLFNMVLLVLGDLDAELDMYGKT